MTRQVVAGWVQNYQNQNFYHWAICLKEDPNQVIGDISVVDQDEKVSACKIGYILSRDYWGQGLMTEALKAVLDYLSLEAGFNRVMAEFVTANPASGHVMEKAGMHYEGTFRQAKLHKGEIKDFSVYGILRADLEARS